MLIAESDPVGMVSSPGGHQPGANLANPSFTKKGKKVLPAKNPAVMHHYHSNRDRQQQQQHNARHPHRSRARPENKVERSVNSDNSVASDFSARCDAPQTEG